MKHWKQTIDGDYEVRVLLSVGLAVKEIAHLIGKSKWYVYKAIKRIKKFPKR